MPATSHTETVQRWFSAVESGDFAGAKKLLSRDFACTGPSSVPLDRDQITAMYKALGSAFPDLAFHVTDVAEHGEDVVATVRMTGTHTKQLAMTLPKVFVVEATGNAIQLPESHPKFTLDGKGKIAKLDLISEPGGGLDGILAQIGAASAQKRVTL